MQPSDTKDVMAGEIPTGNVAPQLNHDPLATDGLEVPDLLGGVTSHP